jgi:hypothetical protein
MLGHGRILQSLKRGAYWGQFLADVLSLRDRLSVASATWPRQPRHCQDGNKVWV